MVETKEMEKDETNHAHPYGFGDSMGGIFAKTFGFGDSPMDELEGDDKKPILPGDWIIFLFSMYTVNILILNTLIAILGDSYDKVVMDR